MIEPTKFYGKEDFPGEEGKSRMWKSIEKNIRGKKSNFFVISDKRSFVTGIAASFILYFAALGLISTAKKAADRSQPQTVKIDIAYQTAIREFEKLIPGMMPALKIAKTRPEYVSVRNEQLRKLDEAIEAMRVETGSGDLSHLKQSRMRQLYSLKLQILQEMIENGEINL